MMDKSFKPNYLNPKKRYSYKISRSVRYLKHEESPKNIAYSRKKISNTPNRFKKSSRKCFKRFNRVKKLKCPDAPHNTTSFLIEYHRLSSYNDQNKIDDDVNFNNIEFFGSNFSNCHLLRNYESNSVYGESQ